MEKSAQSSRFPLNIYLLRQGIDAPLLAIDVASFPYFLTIDIGNGILADLRYGSTGGVPTWLTTLAEFSQEKLPEGLHTASISGLLIATVAERRFVITFGHAWQKIKQRIIEPNFGVRCVLNLAEKDALRAIRRDRIDEDFIQAIEQIPDSDEIERFGMDVERDLLRGVKAKVDTALDFGSWVAGGDSFKTSIVLSTENFASFFERCLALWHQEQYKKNFNWVDNIAPLRDEELEQELNQTLLITLENSPDSLSLCVPELLAWDDFDLFSFQRKKKGHAPCADSLDINAWLGWWSGQDGKINLDALVNQYIYAYKEDGTSVQKWPVLSCIHGLIDYGNQQYLMHGGHWFGINQDFVVKTNKRVESIPVATVALPLPKLKEKEGDYNIRVAGGSGGALLYMDKKLVSHGGGKSRFEVCDLFTDNGHLICVKPWGRASGSLSHLFAQARVSVQLINNDSIYCKKVGEMIAKTDSGFAAIWEIICDNPKDAEVVLAVIRGCPKESLPFFAKLALINCVDDLLNMRFKVSFLALPAAL